MTHDLATAPLRIFLGALAHETNTFSPLPTTLRSFSEGLLHHQGDRATLDKARQFAGYAVVLAIAGERGDHCVDGMCAWAQPAGPLSRRDYEALRDELLDGLRAALPVNFVFLVLHGAMVAEGYWDCEGDLLRRVRELVGPAMPVGVLLDLHGNMSDEMVASGALIVACKEYPHTDYPERARELYGMLAKAARGGPMPRTTMQRVPMVALLGTTEGPVHDFVRRMQACEQSPGVLSVSAMHGFAWSDTPHTGAAILVVFEGQNPKALAQALGLKALLAAEFFRLRTAATAPRLPLQEALDAALAAAARAPAGRPVVLADTADNPGGGAACDSTFVLRALLDRQATGVALGMIWDPQAVAIATDAGVGARLALRIGGKVGPLSGEPVDVMAEVLACRADALQHGLGGLLDPLGAAVAIHAQGMDIVLNSTRQQVFSPDCFTELGVDLSTKRLVVVKSTQHFRAGFDPMASASFYCDAPGTLNGNLAALPYRHLPRPIWPIDPDTQIA